MWKQILHSSLIVVLAGAAAFASDDAALRKAPAPELVGSRWINTPGGKPVTLAQRRGKVTIVEFWTYACINCRHNLPSYARWYREFAARGVTIIGVHTPETEAEHDPANVARKVRELGIEYPVLLDNDYTNWNRWHQQYWPVVYVVDQHGRIRYRWEGELNYRQAGGEAMVSRVVEELLAEGDQP